MKADTKSVSAFLYSSGELLVILCVAHFKRWVTSSSSKKIRRLSPYVLGPNRFFLIALSVDRYLLSGIFSVSFIVFNEILLNAREVRACDRSTFQVFLSLGNIIMTVASEVV